jgi:hypothetical protein
MDAFDRLHVRIRKLINDAPIGLPHQQIYQLLTYQSQFGPSAAEALLKSYFSQHFPNYRFKD